VSSGILSNQLVGLCITADRDKNCLSSDRCSSHLDDKVSVISNCREKRNHRDFPTVQLISEYFSNINRLTLPREFHIGFWRIPTDSSTIWDFKER